MTRAVGAGFEYSNSNYNLLGLIIEAVSGESYATYVEDHIFGPLEMHSSFTTREQAKEHGICTNFSG